MPLRRFIVVFGLLALSTLGFAQGAPSTTPALRIVSPRPGEKLTSNFVTVRYELLNPGASADSSPNFLVRLDGRDPVRTTDTEFTFSGMTAGTHTVMVELVDANGTPINGTRASAQFTITQQPTPAEAVPDHTDLIRQTSGGGGARLVYAVWTSPPSQDQGEPAPAPGRRAADRQLPKSSTALPLLSVIGLGVLLGGMISAMRTR